MTIERVDGLEGAQFVDTSETDGLAVARAREIAARRPDISTTIAAMRRASVGEHLAPPTASHDDEETASETTDQRARLREAITAKEKSHDQYVRTAQAVAKANEMLRVAENDLAALGDIDADLAEFRAARIREAADEGLSASLDLPPELLERQGGKAEVERRIAEIGKAKAQLAAELDKARQKIANAQGAVEKAAQHVLVGHAAALTSELAEVREDLCRRSDELTALANLWLPGLGRGGAMGPMAMPAKALRELEICRGVSGERRVSRAGSDWRSVYDALVQDADAALPGEVEP
jgi:hypothetical protein